MGKGLAIQRLASAIAAGNCASAAEYLDEYVAESDSLREHVQRGRYSLAAKESAVTGAAVAV